MLSRTDTPQPREFTARGVVLGLLLAIVLGAANAYLGLYAGMTVSASIPAAVVSMAVLRLLGRGTILENNFVQTIASAGEAVAAGAIFTFPALVVLGTPVSSIGYWQVTLLCAVGATLGSMLVIMLRRPYIVDEHLPFPEGVACAEVLRSGERGARAAQPLLWGGLLAGVTKAAADIGGLIPQTIGAASWIGSAAVSISCDLSAALFGVGYIIDLAVAAVVVAGGVTAWLVAVPCLSVVHPELRQLAAGQAAMRLWSTQVRFIGVGAMLIGGLTTLWRLRQAIAKALAELRWNKLGTSGASSVREETDLSARSVIAALVISILLMVALYTSAAQSWRLGVLLALVLGGVGFFAAAVSGYLTGMVGSSNNPVSGVTLIVLLAVALLLRLVGISAVVGPAVAILVGAVVAVAAAMAGDSLHDLATGFHLRATPWVLEVGVLIGALASSLAVAPILELLLHAYGIAGTPEARAGALAAPQAFLMAQIVRGVFSADLPWLMIAIGGVLALGLSLLDDVLQRRGSQWRASPMPFAIGLYLPLGLSVAVGIGAGVRRMLTRRGQPGDADETDRGLLFSAGLIAGEALMGIAGAALVTAGVKLPLF